MFALLATPHVLDAVLIRSATGMGPTPPPGKLVCILFGSRAEFDHYVRCVGADAGAGDGHYSVESNRTVFLREGAMGQTRLKLPRAEQQRQQALGQEQQQEWKPPPPPPVALQLITGQQPPPPPPELPQRPQGLGRQQEQQPVDGQECSTATKTQLRERGEEAANADASNKTGAPWEEEDGKRKDIQGDVCGQAVASPTGCSDGYGGAVYGECQGDSGRTCGEDGAVTSGGPVSHDVDGRATAAAMISQPDGGTHLQGTNLQDTIAQGTSRLQGSSSDGTSLQGTSNLEAREAEAGGNARVMAPEDGTQGGWACWLLRSQKGGNRQGAQVGNVGPSGRPRENGRVDGDRDGDGHAGGDTSDFKGGPSSTKDAVRGQGVRSPGFKGVPSAVMHRAPGAEIYSPGLVGGPCAITNKASSRTGCSFWACYGHRDREAQEDHDTSSDIAGCSPMTDADRCSITHEIIHQLAFNTGVQRRGASYPFWVVEGLATNFETFESEVPFGRLKHDTNPCIAQLARSRAQGKLLPLGAYVTLMAPPAGCDDDEWRLMYAQGWALFRMLFLERMPQLVAYMKKLGSQHGDPLSFQIRKDFEQAFGPLPVLQAAWESFLTDLLLV
eukprot:jgi/Mesvir1/29621/Mv21473-RA.2